LAVENNKSLSVGASFNLREEKFSYVAVLLVIYRKLHKVVLGIGLIVELTNCGLIPLSNKILTNLNFLALSFSEESL